MKITKDRIHSWEQVGDKEYEKDFDDELIILLNPDETSKEMGDYVLECQEKARKYDELEDIVETIKKYVDDKTEWTTDNKSTNNTLRHVRHDIKLRLNGTITRIRNEH